MLPNAARAFVEPAKVRDYLLSAAHPVGQFKAPVFQALGYNAANWQRLRDDLTAQALSEPATAGKPSSHGTKFELRATLRGPSGRAGTFKTVWLVRTGEDFPRFVTAIPD